MDSTVFPDIIWYHGSNLLFEELRQGSTVTPLRALAEAFSHRPTLLCIEDDGIIIHNGAEDGYLYVIDEKISSGDVYPHPHTTMEPGMEYLTQRSLRVHLLCKLNSKQHKLL